jgi:hypothetical protein
VWNSEGMVDGLIILVLLFHRKNVAEMDVKSGRLLPNIIYGSLIILICHFCFWVFRN